MPGCGISPSPAISFDVSTMITRLFSSVDSTRALSRKQRGLSDAGPAEQQQALSGFDDVAQNVHRAVHRAAHAARQPDNRVPAVPDAGNPMQRPLDAGAIVLGERAHAMDDIFDVFARDRLIAEVDRAAGKTAFGLTAEIHDDFDQILEIGLTVERILDVGRHDAEQEIEIVRDFLARQFAAPRSSLRSANLKSWSSNYTRNRIWNNFSSARRKIQS